MKTEYSTEEWQTRVELAALYRLAVKYGWTDITSTHISARIPGDSEHYLLNSYDFLFGVNHSVARDTAPGGTGDIARCAEVDSPGQLADHHDVRSLDNLTLQGRGIDQIAIDGRRPKIGEQFQFRA